MLNRKPKVFVADCNYYIHRAFNVAGSKRSLDHLKKNTLTLFLQLVASDIVKTRCTHALLCFDAPNSFRYDIYPQYKANRREGRDGKTTEIHRPDGQIVKVDLTPGALVKDARKLAELAGLAHSWRKRYEADDLLGCASISLEEQGCEVIIGTRDKDIAQLVTALVRLYWPKEEQYIGIPEVIKHWRVKPNQIRDYLCLLGDKGDNIPGVPKFGPETAVKLLKEYGSIAKALKDDKWLKKLKPHRKTLYLARELVTLRTDIKFKVEDLVIKDIDQELIKHVWDVPKSLKDLGEARKVSKMKGLFG